MQDVFVEVWLGVRSVESKYLSQKTLTIGSVTDIMRNFL